MPASMNWTVTRLFCYPESEGQTNVVFDVVWACSGTQIDGGKTYTGQVSNICPVTYQAGSPYTPYNQLTQDQVLGWIWTSGVNKDEVELAVQQQIDTNINPPVVIHPLPWA